MKRIIVALGVFFIVLPDVFADSFRDDLAISLDCPAGGKQTLMRPPQRKVNQEDYWSYVREGVRVKLNVLKYRIRWFNGNWSPWYYPGFWDIDWKTNKDSSIRRVWSYFDDHTHELVTCPDKEFPLHEMFGKKTDSCEDTDGGFTGKEKVRGCIEWTAANGEAGEDCDFCILEDVGEFYCNGKTTQVGFSTIHCPNGCSEGKCL